MVRTIAIAMPWLLAAFVGSLLAVGAVPVILSVANWYREWDEINNPPATLQWHSIKRLDEDSLRMTLLVTRHDNCKIVRLLGYTGTNLQAMQPVQSLEREDGRPPQDYPVGIAVISRPWIMRGIYGDRVAVSAYYDCFERVVKAPLLVGNIPAIK